MNDTITPLEQIASRAISLYSRPTVALQLMRLTEEASVDAKALKDCVAQDPALTCKVLRVVNSSLFGLNRPVADLNQAISMLGLKPLKLLVLGFNLPDALFAEVAARELQWYWTNTLTRAVAARLLGEQLWHQGGDEAFVAGLLQDIGILVLLRELGEPYARFLTGVIDEKCHLAALEQDTIGFDHVQLSAALLSRWQLPQRLVDAITAAKRPAHLAHMTSPEADLPQILHLAELLMQLVGQRRLNVLPELLEAGKAYRGMTKPKLASLVEDLQPQVDQLAEVLSLELTEERDYVRILIDAHRQMSALSEQIAGSSAAGSKEDEAYNQLLAHTNELTGAMQSFLQGDSKREASGNQSGDRWGAQHAAHRTQPGKFSSNGGLDEGKQASMLARKLAAVANRCRERRQELSLIVAEASCNTTLSDQVESAGLHARRAIGTACLILGQDNVTLVSLSDNRTAAILADCERRSALVVAHNAIADLAKAVGSDIAGEVPVTLSIGVATMSVVPKNFDPSPMIESATRCLSAASACGISTVKSIEV